MELKGHYRCQNCYSEFTLNELHCSDCKKANSLVNLDNGKKQEEVTYQKTQEFVRNDISFNTTSSYILVLDIKDKSNILDKIYLQNKDLFTIGRSLENDIILNNNTVSRKHSSIIKKNNRFYIKDHMSLNGIYLNSSNQAIESDTLVELQDNDRLIIGVYDLVFHIK